MCEVFNSYCFCKRPMIPMKHDCERHVLPQIGIWPKVGNKFKKKRTEKKLYTQAKY